MLADPFWLSLVAKMAIVAAIVVSGSLIAERSGPFFAALVATLPISAGRPMSSWRSSTTMPSSPPVR